MFPNDTDFETKVTLETEMASVDDLPFNILFLGDWSGRKGVADSNAVKMRPIEIDRDNFDEIMNQFQVGVELVFEESAQSLTLNFTEIEDFHPDRIFQRVSLFSNLREIRSRLKNPDTYNAAAREVRSWIQDSKVYEPAIEEVTDSVAADDNAALPDNLLEQILGKSSADNVPFQKSQTAFSELDAFIGKLVKPHVIQTDLEEQANLLIVIDELISDLMRKIIHHPDFQALEAAWRGLYLLVRKVETNSNLKIFILDVDKHSISNDLKSVADLTDSRLYQVVNDSDKSWAICCGNYDFGLNVEDAATLIRLAKIGSVANVPFISYIRPEMFGVKSFNETNSSDNLKILEDSAEAKIWNALRSLPEAYYLGLALPRFLARLPYGEQTEPTEIFAFEEFVQHNPHEHYLWSNPTFICAILLGQSFSRFGWELSSNLIQNFEGLPLHYYREASETKVKSCAEAAMTQTNAEILIREGLMPLISFRDTDRVRVGRFQSISFSEKMLNGKWN